MATLLQINSSIFGDNGHSTTLATEWSRQWQQRHPDGEVIVRDLGAPLVPHLDAATLVAFGTAAAERSADQQARVDFADQLLAEIERADSIVLGLPMYNFGVPSALKAYFDHIARAGVSFHYTASGPEGLLTDKPVTVLAARGGMYAGSDADGQTPYIKQFLGFLGLHQVEFIYAEGLNLGGDSQSLALQSARAAIGRRVQER